MMLQVQAHGGGLLKVKDTWYWYGESYKRPLLNDFLSEGVNLYSSSGERTSHAPARCLTCLPAHVEGSPSQPFTQAARPPWQSVKPCACAELKDDIALPLDSACSSTENAVWCLSMPTTYKHHNVHRQYGCPSLSLASHASAEGCRHVTKMMFMCRSGHMALRGPGFQWHCPDDRHAS